MITSKIEKNGFLSPLNSILDAYASDYLKNQTKGYFNAYLKKIMKIILIPRSNFKIHKYISMHLSSKHDYGF